MKRTPGVAKNDWASLGLEVLGGGEDFAVLVGGHLLNGQETTPCTSIRLDWIRACFRPEIRNLTCRHCVHRNRNPGSSLVQTAETSGGNVKNFFVFFFVTDGVVISANCNIDIHSLSDDTFQCLTSKCYDIFVAG
jgi:hypothetical protein